MATQSWLEEAATAVLDVTPTYKIYKLYNGEIDLYFDAGTTDDPKHDYFIFRDGEKVDVPNVTTILKGTIDKSFVLIPWGTKLAVETIRERIFAADGSIIQLSTEEWNALLHEAKNKHKERLDEAGNIGKRAHDALEATIKEAIATTDGYVRSARHAPGLPDTYAPGSDVALELRLSMARSAYMAGLDWIRKHDVQFISTEKKVFSRNYFFTGTSDGVGYVTICDDPKCCRGYQAGLRVCGCIDWKSSNQLNPEYALQTAAYVFAEIEETALPITHRFINRLGKTDSSFETWLCGPDFFEDDLNSFLDCLRQYKSLSKLKARRQAEKDAVSALIKAEKAKAKQAKLDLENAEKATKKAAKEEAKLIKLAETDALKAIRKADREEARLAKQAAKPVARPVLVQGTFRTVVCPDATMTIIREGQPDEVRPMRAEAKPDDEPEPGIAHTVQAACVARFWSVSSTTIEGRIM